MSTSSYHASSGAAYEAFLGRWSRRLGDAMVEFAGFSDEGALLDIGCGTGSLAFAMAARFPGRRVVGIDAAASYIDFARTRTALSSTVFDVGDACALPYADGAFEPQHTLFLLHDTGQGWSLAEFAVGPTDIAWDWWRQQHGLPQTLFKN